MSKQKKVRKAIIPAAGLGTRFLPATKALAKEMLPIVDKPAIQYIVEEAVNSGIEEILIVISQYKNSIMDYFDYSFELEERLKEKNKMKEYKMIRNIADMIKVQFVRQKEPLGLGHAILCAETFIGDEPFAVLLGDDIVVPDNDKCKPAIKQCIEAYEKTNASIMGVQQVLPKNISKYGIIDIDAKLQSDKSIFKLKGTVEKPSLKDAPSDYAILGRYVLTPTIFDELKKTKIDIRGEIELTDAIMSLMSKESVYAKTFDGHRYDIGNKAEYVIAIIDEALKNSETNERVLSYIKELEPKLNNLSNSVKTNTKKPVSRKKRKHV